MSETATLSAQQRDDRGKKAAKRLRHEGDVPAVVYGREIQPVRCALNRRAFEDLVHAHGRNAIITLTVDGDSQGPHSTIIKDVQVDYQVLRRRPEASQMDLLLVAAILLIGNTIRLSIFARRREVEVMKLVGATNWFIRWPFVIEGVLCGLVGALLAVGLLYAVKLGVVDKWITDNDPALTRDTATTIGFATLGTILVLAGGLVGAVGSGLTIRRFLKV